MAQVLAKQVLRSGMSPGAQYREAFRSRSRAEFLSKIGGALQELDETAYWLELIVESGIVPARRMSELLKETNELIAIFTAAAKTTKRNR